MTGPGDPAAGQLPGHLPHHLPGVLTGRVAVVVGATGWIGTAVCRELVRAGASVVLVARDPDRLDELRRDLAADDRVATARADVTAPLEVDDARATALERFGRVDLVVAAAGVITGSAFAEGVPADWADMTDVNLRGLLHVAQAFADPLLASAEAGGPADLVLLGAVSTDVRAPRFAVFNALSAAVKQLARALRLEYGARGLRVHLVEPSFAVGDADDPATGPGTDDYPYSARASAVLRPEAIATAVALATALPASVNLAELLLLPTEAA